MLLRFLVLVATVSFTEQHGSCDVTLAMVSKILAQSFPFALHPKQIARSLSESDCKGLKVDKSSVISIVTELIEEDRATRVDGGVRASFDIIMPVREVVMILREGLSKQNESVNDEGGMFCLNIGGGNYKAQGGWEWLRSDPTYEIFTLDHWAGLILDADKESIRVARENITSPHVNVVNSYLTPMNILGILEENNVPRNLDFFKIDIDSFDAILVEKILTEYRPKVLNVEINADIPIPLKFAVGYREGVVRSPPNIYSFFGASLSYWSHLLKPLGYSLLLTDIKFAVEGAVYVQNEYLELFHQHVSIPPNEMIAFRTQIRVGRHNVSCTRMEQYKGFTCAEMDLQARERPFELVGRLFEHFSFSSKQHNNGVLVPFSISLDFDFMAKHPWDPSWEYVFDSEDEKGQVVFIESPDYSED